MVTQIPNPYISKLGVDDRRTRYDALNNKVRYLERSTRTVGSLSGAGGGGGGGGGGSSLLKIIDEDTAYTLQLLSDSTADFTADRTLTLDLANANRALTLQGNLVVESLSTLNQDLTTDAQPTFAQVTLGSEPDVDDEAATKKYVDDNVGTTLDYFFNDTANAIGGIYYNMTTAVLGGIESTLSTAGLIAADDQPLVNFTSEPATGAELNTLEAGIYDVHFHAERTGGNRDTTIYAEIYKRAGGGAETLLMTSEETGLVVAKEGFDVHAYLAAEEELLTTDLIVVKFYANCGIGANTTIALYQEGALDSHVTIHVASSVFSNIFIRQDGTTPLTADWDAGAFKITAQELSTDVLSEETGAAGVTIDGLLVKDNAIGSVDAEIELIYMDDSAIIYMGLAQDTDLFRQGAGELKTSGKFIIGGILEVDDILEVTGAHGVEIDGVLLKDGDVTIAPGKSLFFLADVNLYRSAVNTLRTDDHLWIGANIISVGTIYGQDNAHLGIYAESTAAPQGKNLILYVYDTGEAAYNSGLTITPVINGIPTVSTPGTLNVVDFISDGMTRFDRSALSINAGEITVTRTYHTVDTEGDAAADDLDTINGGSTGDILVLRTELNTQDVTVKNNTGNILLAGADFVLSTIFKRIVLMYDSGGARWYELSRSDNA